ncbi:MAG TPA: hypothetical protein VFR86_16800 [Burkholderiaceae bacterium]|nr:hypothetical protein [Burkholderiaceae bacterium]
MNAVELLALWERAANSPAYARDDALLSSTDGAPASLGARNAALLELRARCFGDRQGLRTECPHCRATAEFTIDCVALAQALLPACDTEETRGDQRLSIDDDLASRLSLTSGPSPGGRGENRASVQGKVHTLETAGHRLAFRLPTTVDVREATFGAEGDEAFVAALLQRCVERCETADGAPCDVTSLPAAVAMALSQRMEELEPGAHVGFDLACPECNETWHASMNVGDVLWSELQVRAERLVLDVDALARAYGWSEAQVLALSPTRRAAYLQLVGAGS